jgi:GNAT superfamily N-acetyltransferase
MKLKHLFESHEALEFVTPHEERDDMYELMDQAEKLVHERGLRMLRNDEISEVVVHGDKVVGVLYNGHYDNELTSSIAVDPSYEGRGLAKELFSRIPFDQYEPLVNTHVCEVLPPYTMEKFLVRNGYEHTETDRDIKIYKKEI